MIFSELTRDVFCQPMPDTVEDGQWHDAGLIGFVIDQNRKVLFRADGTTAAGKQVSLEVEDPHRETTHTASLTASRFGVISDDWTLPANAELGEYRFMLSSADGSNRA